MIYIDPRVGSKELLPLFPKNMACLSRLQFADAAFLGRGPDDVPVYIGIERKRILDLLDSMCTGRLSGYQIPGLLSSYTTVYLVIEGIWRPNPKSGLLEKIAGRGEWKPIKLGQRTFMAREIYNYLNTMALFQGVYIWFTSNGRQTAILIQSLYHWWNDKPFSAHSSHEKVHTPAVKLRVRKRNIVEKIASELPGIGYEKSRLVGEKFSTVLEMVLANEKDWKSIPGIGKTLSQRIVKLLQETDPHE